MFRRASGIIWLSIHTSFFLSKKRRNIKIQDYNPPVALQDTEIYDRIKDIIGINDFVCFKTIVEDCTWYDFIPKCFLETK